ncbi:hypothetical protein EWM64_g9798 [Hericium alpestre]|uniref:Glucose receptor Git3 N-terminal domain-containing protein n=1 Tax=Hericium alpestre TaxID=135208 RepID=A0A4Y9ZID9_9AGAM|nr:hypothetical protein EWM64_g9798 [Hericium alpestre]
MGAALSRKNLESQDAAGGTTTQLPGFAGLDVSFRDELVYDDLARAFMTAIVFASALSLVSVLLMWILALASRGPAKTAQTNLLSFVNCLLLANGIQAVGSLFSTQWVIQGAVTSGSLCSFQGAVKQAGNVGAAVWHVFLSNRVTNVAKWTIIFVGWFVVIFVVIIGPTAIQNKEHGPYFSVSGYWCWVTEEYPAEQTFLEYFIVRCLRFLYLPLEIVTIKQQEWLSAFLSILLYTCILLRVRGNSSEGQCWKLAMGRDILDTVMVRVAAVIVWYPVAYTILIFPISVARFSYYAGAHVPAWATFTCDLIFSLSGFANLMLTLVTSRLLPDMNDLPTFATQRKIAPPPNGITPFTFTPADASSENISKKYQQISQIYPWL